MTQKELEFARKRYKTLTQENEATESELKELKQLMQDPKIKRFIKLQTKYKHYQPEIKKTDDLILNAFGYAVETIEDNGIYVFVGKTRKIENVYKNLETTREHHIYIEKEKEEFEKNNYIIKLDHSEDKTLHYSYDQIEQYKKLRTWFLKELLKDENTQEKVVQKVKTLKQNDINQIVKK